MKQNKNESEYVKREVKNYSDAKKIKKEKHYEVLYLTRNQLLEMFKDNEKEIKRINKMSDVDLEYLAGVYSGYIDLLKRKDMEKVLKIAFEDTKFSFE